MSNFDLEIEWQDPGGARIPELRATWAMLRVSIADEWITRVYDTSLNSVRTGVYLPLYPLAEWIVMNWWSLLYECERPGQSTKGAYSRRHNVRYGGEGFALPSLELRPTSGHFGLRWDRRALPDCRLEFIRYGEAMLPAAAVEESLTGFIRRVISRLEERGVTNTALQEDWRAIEAQDVEQSSFCRAVGAMGLDPFDLPDALSHEVQKADQALPDSVEQDFFEAAEPSRIGQQLQWVQEGLQLAGNGKSAPELSKLRDQLGGINGESTPWDQGYAFARRVRQELQLRDKERVELDELGIGGATIALHPQSAQVGFDALTVVGSDDDPAFVVRPTIPANQRFSACRGLFEYLQSPTSKTTLVSSTISDKQKRNRAFAAELLAPARLLKASISGSRVAPTEVDELAQRFGVSTFVVAHQIENHQLGRVV